MNSNIELENLLGEHLSVAEEKTDIDFKKITFRDITFYRNSENFEKFYYGMFFNHISLQTSEDDKIQSITVHFRKIIDRQFYDSFVNKYGKPNNTQVVENIKQIGETKVREVEGNITQHSKKNTFELREGSFDENPLYIIWEKENYQIRAFLRHEQNISEIKFSVKTN